jgi:putative membrane protein insertion efficiency factor
MATRVIEAAVALPGRCLAAALVGIVRVYQLAVSPWLGPRCRFVPTCSEYAIEAIRRYGALRGGALAARRILRCHPWGGTGYDPIPEEHSCDSKS